MPPGSVTFIRILMKTRIYCQSTQTDAYGGYFRFPHYNLHPPAAHFTDFGLICRFPSLSAKTLDKSWVMWYSIHVN